MKTSKLGIDLIKVFEGCKLKAYKCPAGIWTIGYGNTYYPKSRKVQEGDTITQVQAETLLSSLLVEYEQQVDGLKLNINQNQFDALVSLNYNIGFGRLSTSQLIKMIKVNPLSININTEWARFIFAKGLKLPGLVRRRNAELELYFKPLV